MQNSSKPHPLNMRPSHSYTFLQSNRPINTTSSQIIDLTLDDDDDEPMDSQIPQESVNNIAGGATSAIMPVIEDVESDVDEEWPNKAPLLMTNQASYNQTQEDVRVTLAAISKTIPLSITGSEKSLNNDVDNELEVNEVSKTDGGPVTTTDRVVAMENLEDGEIFEEGVKSLKPILPKNTIEQSNGDRYLVDAMGIRPNVRSKKQKKRGKKKMKRKLDAMQMMQASSGQMYPRYERAIRPRPFTDTPSPGHYKLAIMRNEPGNGRPVFQDVSPALFRAGNIRVGIPHPPIRPPLQQRPIPILPLQQRPVPSLPPQQRPAPSLPPQQRPVRPLLPQLQPARPLPPPYEDSQILRVNRQGSMEMINGEAKLPFRPIISEPPTFGGFKYRLVSVFPPLPVPNGPGFPLQRSACDSSRFPPVRTSSGGNSTSSVASTGRDESGEVDLDSLRAAALRTKLKRSLKQMERAAEAVTAVQSSPSTSVSSSRPVHSEEKQANATSPEIDKLRFDILQSMTKNRNRSTTSKALNVSLPMSQVIEPTGIEKPDESGMNKVTKSNISAAQGDPSASKDPSERTLTLVSAGANVIGSGGASSETDKSTNTSEQSEVVSKIASQLAMNSEKAKPSAKFAMSTPEFRPLTASSQSLVIQLGPEDFLPQKSKDDAALSSGLQDAIKEMRRKIAEREKEQTNRLLASAATGLSKPVPSSALSSPSLESKVSSVVTQFLSATVASPGVSIPDAESVKESSAGRNVDRFISVQTEANQAKKVMKEVSQSPFETLLSVETARSAAGRESSLKAASEPQVRSDISRGLSTLTITDGVVADTRCDSIIPAPPISSDEPSFEVDHDLDAIRAEYQQCVTECEEAEVHIARLSNEMAQLEKQLHPLELTVEKS